MNVLQPEILIIGNRRYRRSPFRLAFQDSSSELAPYQEENDDDYQYTQKKYDEENDEPCDLITCKATEPDEYKDIQPLGDEFKLNMIVNEAYFGYLIGRNGEKKNKIEIETKTRIKVPKRGQGDWLVIEGKDKASVDSCRNRVLVIINAARHQKPFTHLITFPLIHPNLRTKFEEFKRDVLRTCQDDRGVDDSIFQNSKKLHLTIVTAVIISNNEIDQAKDLLELCKNTIINELLKNKPLKVNIKGLEYMNDDPSNVDVLYAQVKPVSQTEQNPIQLIADHLMEKFISSGLSKRQFDKVKLHATVMNTLLRQDPSGTSEPNRDQTKNRESFDARQILKHFGAYDFGVYDLNEIHLSLRYSTARDGYYECVAKIQF